MQVGAQHYARALVYMTDAALQDSRRASGWAASADVRHATPQEGASIGKETTKLDPVIGLISGQRRLIAGASLAGVKYSRIIP